ncbi:MAG: hypothetical protein JSU82_05535 [Rhodospirillales bacterium]|nr:MAG: hypothetical protein JSU82_05535 [Rhodospirillales bacterium]
MDFDPRLKTASRKRPGTAVLAGLGFALAVTLVASPPGAAAGPGPDAQFFRPAASPRILVHGNADAVDRAGAIEEAKHAVEELSAEKRIDEGWKSAAVAGAETRTLRVFKVWVVHLKSAADIGGHGTDLFIFLSETGEFLKFSYKGR